MKEFAQLIDAYDLAKAEGHAIAMATVVQVVHPALSGTALQSSPLAVELLAKLEAPLQPLAVFPRGAME